MVLVDARPARAADSVQCGPAATVFAAESNGVLRRYPLNSPANNPATYGDYTPAGTGWNIFGRVLGGPDGRVYGINSSGMYLYQWNGSGWPVHSRFISSGFTAHATAPLRDKITIDEAGDFYLVDADGKLLRHRYDEASNTWTTSGQLVATGWGQYDLIVAGSAGVLYARTPAGEFFRFRYDVESQRVIQPATPVGAGWQWFTKGIFSVGGDTLFGILANGDQLQYRYREDNNTWVVHAAVIGSGWETFPNVFATTNTCRLTVSHTPARPSTPVVSYTPVAVRQMPGSGSQLGPVEYAYTDNIGRLVHGRQSNVDNGSSTQWAPVASDHAFTGTPALISNPQGLVQIASQNTGGDYLALTQASAGSPLWAAWVGLGGFMKYPPAVARMPDSTMVMFGVDAAGALWVRHQDGTAGQFLPWRPVGSAGAGLAGTPLVADGSNGSRTLIVAGAGGTLHTARYTAGTLSSWTSLGGSGFTGAPSVVALPGNRLRIFARAATGEILMRQQEADGTMPGGWSPVGTFTAAGAPSAILDPTGRLSVVARGTDGEVYAVFETGQGTLQWGTWNRVNPLASDPAQSDPTVARIVNGSGETWVIVWRNINNQVRRYDRSLESTAAARSTAPGSAPFTPHPLS
ncbi:tachylectin-related carbohydrate-binding protein [Actinomycetes bacterium KLBMP 9797]